MTKADAANEETTDTAATFRHLISNQTYNTPLEEVDEKAMSQLKAEMNLAH